jgi:hypothetical protein
MKFLLRFSLPLFPHSIVSVWNNLNNSLCVGFFESTIQNVPMNRNFPVRIRFHYIQDAPGRRAFVSSAELFTPLRTGHDVCRKVFGDVGAVGALVLCATQLQHHLTAVAITRKLRRVVCCFFPANLEMCQHSC